MKEDRDKDGGGVLKIPCPTVPRLLPTACVETAVDVDSRRPVILAAGLEVRPDLEGE